MKRILSLTLTILLLLSAVVLPLSVNAISDEKVELSVDWELNRYNANTGLKENDPYSRTIRSSDYIDVSSYERLDVDYTGAYSWNVCFYNKDKAFLSSSNGQYAYADEPATINLVENTAYITVSIYKVGISLADAKNIKISGIAPVATPDEAEPIVNASVAIDKTYLKTGETLKVDNPDNCELKYFVGDEEVEEESLTLKTDYYEKWITVKGYLNGKKVAQDKVYFSKLPIIYINTEDGKSITSKTDYKKAEMSIQDNDTVKKPVYSGSIDIRGRGNTSWSINPKKPYKIKLDKKTDLFGMGKNKHWVLLACYLDNSYMRNMNATRLSHQLNMDTMDSVWTELILNGKYVGVYQLSEQVKIGKTRIDIFDWEEEAESVASAVCKAEAANGVNLSEDDLGTYLTENLDWITTGSFTFNDKTYNVADYYKAQSDTSGGYLFEMSHEYDEVSKFTTDGGLKVMLKSPEFLSSNANLTDYVKSYWQNFENAYKSENGYTEINGKKTHYTELADIDSMVSFWLVNEILGNDDAAYKSRFAYKPIGGKLKFGPTWDFDYGCASCPVGNRPYSWKVSKETSTDKMDANFYKEFLDDPLFIAKATEKYWQVRPYLQSLIEEGGQIDKDIDYLKEAGVVDNELWDRHAVYPKLARNYEDDANTYKDYMTKRIGWLDKQFETNDTLINSTRISASAYPYTNAKDVINTKLLNVKADNAEHAKSDGLLSSNENLSLSVDVSDNNTVEIETYVNGIYDGNVMPTNGKITFDILKDNFTEGDGNVNVVSLIGKDANGNSTYKTFKTVKTFYEEPQTNTETPTENVTEKPVETINTESTTTTYKLGDVDRNGVLNVSDATCIAYYINGLYELDDEQIKLADVNEDGTVTKEDIIMLQNIISNNGEDEPSTETPSTNATVAPTTNANVETKYLLGDVDRDGRVTVRDATVIQYYAAKLYELDDEQLKLADANNDGSVNVRDATVIQYYAVRLIDFDGEKFVFVNYNE